MKATSLALLLLASLALPAFGQLRAVHHRLRPGDALVKQQVAPADPGASGRDVLWDFSRLATVSEAYALTYSLPPLEGDSVYLLGERRYPKGAVADGEGGGG